MSMLNEDDALRLTAALVSRAGGYLRNPVRQPYVTCLVCTEPVGNGWSTCYVCGNRAADGLADATAFLTYAIGGSQSAYVMRAYKAHPPVQEHVWTVVVMVWLALSIHQHCPARLGGMAVTHWATVPSLRPSLVSIGCITPSGMLVLAMRRAYSPQPAFSGRVILTRPTSSSTVSFRTALMCS